MAAEIKRGQTWTPKRGICIAIIDTVLSDERVRVTKRDPGGKLPDRTVDLKTTSLRRDYELGGTP